MAQCVVIADDLTGGNATGVLLRKMGYQANTVLNLAAVDPEIVQSGDCVYWIMVPIPVTPPPTRLLGIRKTTHPKT